MAATIGHSFGLLTALCVSGSITLEGAIKLVLDRAKLIQGCWSRNKGVMISIHSDLATVSEIMSLAQEHVSGQTIEIACYNGPKAYVLVGQESSMRAVEEVIALSQESSQFLKAKRLDVTHGFHSHLIDPIIPGLNELANTIEVRKPKTPIETCTKNQSWSRVQPSVVAAHSHEPMYFSDAVRRLEARYGSCACLEVGARSNITSAIRSALDPSVGSTRVFQPILLTFTNTLKTLVDAATNLWGSGATTQFWSFHQL